MTTIYIQTVQPDHAVNCVCEKIIINATYDALFHNGSSTVISDLTEHITVSSGGCVTSKTKSPAAGTKLGPVNGGWSPWGDYDDNETERARPSERWFVLYRKQLWATNAIVTLNQSWMCKANV
eukprot:Awhi_evm2s5028